MSVTDELFGSLPIWGTASPDDSMRRSTAPPEVAFLVTNHLNLLYILAAGLIMPPAAGARYYRDPLASFPGWIPLFVGRVPEAALRVATEEARHLKPVIAEIRLNGLSGTVQAIDPGGVREIRFPAESGGTGSVLLMPAPLPVSRIVSILFPSPDERRAFDDASADFGNVPVQDFRRGTRKTLFAKTSDEPWPALQHKLERQAPPQIPLAAGGVIAMLLHQAHRGELAVEACRRAFDPYDDAVNGPGLLADDPILAGLSGWMRSGVTPAPPPVEESDRRQRQNVFQQRLFWEFVERLVQRGRRSSDQDILFEFLHDAGNTLNERLKPGAEELIETLKSLTGLVDITQSESFDKHRTPMARAMILFCLRRSCADLLDFGHGALRESDWLAAAVLFGARDGWLGLPADLRTVPGLARGELQAAISHRMARLAHRMAGTDLKLGPCPPRVRPLRELLDINDAWGARQRSAALKLSRACRWDCITTRVSLAKGEYRVTVSGGSVHFDLPGEPRIASQIDRDRFFDYLANGRIDPRIEAKARKLLR